MSDTAEVRIEEHQYPNRSVYGIFYLAGKEIGRADKTPDGWWIPQHTKEPVSPEEAPKVILKTVIARAKRNEKEARRLLGLLGDPKPKSRAADQPITIKAYLAECRAKGVKAIPENDPVFDYADSIGLPEGFLELAWREFVDRASEGEKKQKGWPQTFRNYIRGNWLKLWFKGDRGWVLTQAGLQAQTRFSAPKPAQINGAHP